MSSVSAEELLHGARAAAGRHDVRVAVRELALHALRGHALTAAHVATVARTVGAGIRSSQPAREATGRGTRRGAWAGLEDAVGLALQAVELAIREAAAGRAPMSGEERERMRLELAQLGRSLRAGWEPPNLVPGALASRIALLDSLLGQVEARASPATPNDESAALAVLASAILLRLTEAPRRPICANVR